MAFDPRWSDDSRERDDRGRELNQGSRGGLSNPRDAYRSMCAMCSRATSGYREAVNGERVWARDSDVTLRGSEVRTLASVGAFRVVPAGDLRDGQDPKNSHPAEP